MADVLGVSTEAFRQPAASATEPKRGRPPKPKAEEEKPKRPRGRPKKET
jgi:hypothetical protein